MSASEKRDALGRVLSSSEMASAPRARDFLRYVVEQEIAGRADLLKGYTIATEALGRREAFDADLQSAVRVQAKRLRERLSAYYGLSGQADPVIIEIPRGAYVPVFRRRPLAEAGRAPPADASPANQGAETQPVVPESAEPAVAAPQAAPAPRAKAPAGGWKFLTAVAATAVVLALAGFVFGLGADRWRRSVPSENGDHYLGVQATPLSDPALRPVADAFVAAVKSRLADFDDFIVIEPPSSESVRHYTLKIGFYPGVADKVLSYNALLTNPVGGALYSEQNALAGACSATFDCAARLAAKIAAPYGVIYADELKNDQNDARDCEIETFEYFRHQSRGDLPAVEVCLRTEIARRPHQMPAMTALSRIFLEEYRLGVKPSDGADPLAAAAALAERALELGPQKARAFKSIFEARFFQQRYDDAFAAARRALEINPYAADILYRVGAARIARGEFEQGKALLDRALDLNPAPPHWVQFYFFLAAFGTGDQSAAAQAAEAPHAETAPFGLLARAIVAQQRKDFDAKRQDLLALAKAFPTVAADIPGALERYRLTIPLQRKLLAALQLDQPPLGR